MKRIVPHSAIYVTAVTCAYVQMQYANATSLLPYLLVLKSMKFLALKEV